MAAQHPEVRAEIDAIEQALEVYAQMHGQTLPEGTFEEIQKRVDGLRAAETKPAASGSPGKSPTLLIAFVTIAAIISIMAAFVSYNGKRQTELRIAGVQARLDSIRVACDAIARENIANRAELEFLKDLSTRPIIMRGKPDKVSAAVAAVYVNPEQGKAYLNVVNLPAPTPGKQYQLWALVGKAAARDMGVFDLPTTPGQLKEIAFRPEFADKVTFAVTLEDAGGKTTPNLTQLYLISDAS